jgi:hypothetical protein
VKNQLRISSFSHLSTVVAVTSLQCFLEFLIFKIIHIKERKNELLASPSCYNTFKRQRRGEERRTRGRVSNAKTGAHLLFPSMLTDLRVRESQNSSGPSCLSAY